MLQSTSDLSDPNNMMAILLNNMLWEEDIARQRAPLDNEIFAELRQMAIASKCKDSVSDLLFDVVALGFYIGPRLSEYAQTTQDKVDHHTYPSGKTVIKAFIANDFIVYNEKKRIVKDLNKDFLQQARFVKDYLAYTKEPPKRPINYPHGREGLSQNMPHAQRNATGTTGQMAESAG